jgi:hypothetical protein
VTPHWDDQVVSVYCEIYKVLRARVVGNYPVGVPHTRAVAVIQDQG